VNELLDAFLLGGRQQRSGSVYIDVAGERTKSPSLKRPRCAAGEWVAA
jgi:hypothetical protein